MGKSGLLSVLLLVLVVLGYGPRPSLAECTFTNRTNVYEGEKVISVERPESGNAVYVNSFSVRLSSGFRSVKLTATAEAEIDGSEQTVLFTHLIKPDDECFVAGQWMKVSMWADLGKDRPLGFRVGKCWKECWNAATTAEKLVLRWLNITARGRSEWTKEVPGKGCTKQLNHVDHPTNFPTCYTQILERSSSLPLGRTSTQLSSSPTGWVVIVVVVSVVVVTGAMLVLTEMCCRKKRRNTTVTDASARENSTYETFNNHHAAAGDSGIAIIENESYDPFSDGQDTAGGRTDFTENKFYKPFSYTGGPVGVRTENNCYENEIEGVMEGDT